MSQKIPNDSVRYSNLISFFQDLSVLRVTNTGGNGSLSLEQLDVVQGTFSPYKIIHLSMSTF